MQGKSEQELCNRGQRRTEQGRAGQGRAGQGSKGSCPNDDACIAYLGQQAFMAEGTKLLKYARRQQGKLHSTSIVKQCNDKSSQRDETWPAKGRQLTLASR